MRWSTYYYGGTLITGLNRCSFAQYIYMSLPFNLVYLDDHGVKSKTKTWVHTAWLRHFHTFRFHMLGRWNGFRLSLPDEEQMPRFLCLNTLKNEPVFTVFIFSRLSRGIAGFSSKYSFSPMAGLYREPKHGCQPRDWDNSTHIGSAS